MLESIWHNALIQMKTMTYKTCILLILWSVLYTSDLFALTLQEKVKRDIEDGKSVVVTSYVGLWYENSKFPEKNLYWGALYGHDSFFKRKSEIKKKLPFLKVSEYKTVYEIKRSQDPLVVKVISSSLEKKNENDDQNVKGNVIIVYLVYKNMEKAVFDMGMHLKMGQTPQYSDMDPEITELLSRSYIMGYWGHNIYYGGTNLDALESVDVTAEDHPRGIFMVGCQTAKWFPQKFISEKIEPLIFTRTNMAPEAYIAAALYDGIANGMTPANINRNIAQAYKIYQKLEKPPYSLFMSDKEIILDYADDIN